MTFTPKIVKHCVWTYESKFGICLFLSKEKAKNRMFVYEHDDVLSRLVVQILYFFLVNFLRLNY